MSRVASGTGQALPGPPTLVGVRSRPGRARATHRSQHHSDAKELTMSVRRIAVLVGSHDPAFFARNTQPGRPSEAAVLTALRAQRSTSEANHRASAIRTPTGHGRRNRSTRWRSRRRRHPARACARLRWPAAHARVCRHGAHAKAGPPATRARSSRRATAQRLTQRRDGSTSRPACTCPPNSNDKDDFMFPTMLSRKPTKFAAAAAAVDRDRRRCLRHRQRDRQYRLGRRVSGQFRLSNIRPPLLRGGGGSNARSGPAAGGSSARSTACPHQASR